MGVIELRGVSLWRRTQEELAYDLKRIVLQSLERRYRPPAQRKVLDSIDLVVERGEKVGIVGPNGAGKSTLLKIISGILQPSRGTVRVDGRTAPLIELGAGFDNDLSVVDNVIYFGVLLGFSKEEMRARISPILEFAELEEYAKAPLKSLSSGMVARLGFAITTDRRPEILILDEVLSVGDARFVHKSTQRIAEFWDAHSTILVVSHSLEFIASQCERAIWLDSGRIVASGPASEITEQYLQHVFRAIRSGEAVEEAEIGYALDSIFHRGVEQAIDSASRIATISVESNEPVRITGWAADLANRVPASSLAFQIDGKFVARVACSAPRPDVSDLYREPRLEPCGFSVALPTHDLTAGLHEVAMHVSTNDLTRPHVVPLILRLKVGL